jgi:outer membrane protein OmpA-like peptidoglycan-associated protein
MEVVMMRMHSVSIALAATFVAGCAARQTPPSTLLDARTDFVHARDGVAARLDPADVHEAAVALQRAEQAFESHPDDPTTAELALIADRRALYAQSQAGILEARGEQQRATAALEASRAQQLQQSQQALGATQMQLQQEQSAAEQQRARALELEGKLKDARETIAKIATVKDDERGMVITLPGEVLFKTAKSDLKPAAMAKLDEIAQALSGKEQPIVVYGYTDDVGTRDHNVALSTARAQSVRDYLAGKGIPKDLIESKGMGPDSPVSDNTSIEGRAQNRRVEIVVQPRK